MNNDRKMSSVCRLCLNSTLENCEKLVNDNSPEEKIKFLMPEININITPILILCTNCSHSLNSAYCFKNMCIEIDKEIKKYATDSETVDLEYVRNQIYLESIEEKTDVDVKGDGSINNDDTTEIFPENIKIEDIQNDAYKEKSCKEDQNQKHEDISVILKCEQSSETLNQELPKQQQQSDKSFTEYKCEVCHKTFKSLVSLKRHISTHTIRENKYFCDVCSKGFKKKQQLDAHVQKTHSGKSWTCDICGKSYSCSRYLQSHKRNTHVSKCVCSTCGLSCGNKNQLIEHIRTHTGERPYKCEFCGKGFAQQGSLGYHIKYVHHNTEKSFVCDTCGRAFTAESYLSRHMESHTNVERNIICPQCNKAFKRRRNLLNHIKIHSPRKRNHKCTVCDREFYQKHKLILHIRIHTGEKPYECHTCHKTFTQKSNLQIHFKSHIPKKAKIAN